MIGTAATYGIGSEILLDQFAPKLAHNPVFHAVKHIGGDLLFSEAAKIFSKASIDNARFFQPNTEVPSK